ncbi:hypothetical protein OSB04_003329 [Centaurea solstitialis]|uniref:Uncharacterized protein n=1 Tax=Centaurea solstitialis TaxID=347529 RepID=A0AA38U247_9ASTR|nr:hypothetical protein OSB04_003329 [Centaurea solstitialis]
MFVSLLHRHPLPTLDEEITELLSEESRLQLCHPVPANTVLYIPHSAKLKGKWNNNEQSKFAGKASSNKCTLCHSTYHPLLMCLILKASKELGNQGNNIEINLLPNLITSNGPAPAVPSLHYNNSSPDPVELMRRNQKLMEHIMIGSMGMSSQYSSASTSSRLLGNTSFGNVSCLSCQLGKHHTLPFEINEFKSASPFDLIHSNVWGPTRTHLWEMLDILLLYR